MFGAAFNVVEVVVLNVPVNSRKHARTALWFLIPFALAGCMVSKQREIWNTIPPGRDSLELKNIVAVTLKDGRIVQFDKGSHPYVVHDSVQATVASKAIAIPVADVARLQEKRLSLRRTIILGLAIPYAAFGVYLARVGVV